MHLRYIKVLVYIPVLACILASKSIHLSPRIHASTGTPCGSVFTDLGL